MNIKSKKIKIIKEKFLFILKNSIELKFKTYAIIILTALLPIIFISILSIKELENVVNKNLEYNLMNNYEKLINNSKNNYRNLCFNIENFANTQIKPIIKSKDIKNISVNSFNEYNYIENIFILDENFSIKYNPKNQPIRPNILDKIKSSQNVNTIQMTDFYCENDKISQYIFYRIVENDEVVGCVIFQINNSIFQIDEVLNKNIQVEIYNSEFYIIASKERNSLGQVVTREVSKKIIEGNSDFIYVNDNKLKAGFTYINNMSLIVNVYQNRSEIYADNFNLKKNIFFTTILVLIFSLVLAYKFYGRIEAISKEKNLEEKNQYIILQELNQKINEIVVNLDIIHEKNIDILHNREEILKLKDNLNGEESDKYEKI